MHGGAGCVPPTDERTSLDLNNHERSSVRIISVKPTRSRHISFTRHARPLSSEDKYERVHVNIVYTCYLPVFASQTDTITSLTHKLSRESKPLKTPDVKFPEMDSRKLLLEWMMMALYTKETEMGHRTKLSCTACWIKP